jgi:putative hydrolase of the HAD superfamily
MIVAFDLDDTLYRELDYVDSGFHAVASHVAEAYGLDPDVALDAMHESLDAFGRGRQFDDLLERFGLFTRRRRDRLVQVYRQHRPSIALPPASDRALRSAASAGHRMFLVTDGNKVVQANKVTALGLWERFDRVYLTGRYGLTAAKPSPRVFELILRRTGARPADLVYIGDDPAKDFVGVRRIGGRTIRVRTGPHATVLARPGYDADVDVGSVGEAVESIIRGVR